MYSKLGNKTFFHTIIVRMTSTMAPSESTVRNAAIGSALQMFEISTLGIVFDNLKTVMAAHRNDRLRDAIARVYGKGGVGAFYRGLIPWGWIEASTKGGVLLATSSFVTSQVAHFGASTEVAGAVGGVAGGIAQAYAVMGFSTMMRTVEITRGAGPRTEGTLAVAMKVLRRDGIRGMYRGVNAVAIRQSTNWGSRFFFSRLMEGVIRRSDADRHLTKMERVGCSAIGGGLACWNQPLEVIRVQQQISRDGGRLGMIQAARQVYEQNGFRGFYRGVTPRVCLSVYLTVVMVFGGDEVKQFFEESNLDGP